MDGDKIDNIAWFAPVGCSRCLQNSFPCGFKSGFGQGLLVGNLKPSLRIWKDVDIRGKTRTFAVQLGTCDCSSVRGTAESFDVLR